jgi:hypothetical protein
MRIRHHPPAYTPPSSESGRSGLLYEDDFEDVEGNFDFEDVEKEEEEEVEEEESGGVFKTKYKYYYSSSIAKSPCRDKPRYR